MTYVVTKEQLLPLGKLTYGQKLATGTSVMFLQEVSDQISSSYSVFKLHMSTLIAQALHFAQFE